MSPLSRHRRAAATAATVFVGVPLVLAGVAFAGPARSPTASVPDSGREVVFTGDGVLGVACRADPSPISVVVPAGATLRMVNDTATAGDLLIDGVPSGVIEQGASLDVLVHRGPVSLAVKPDCVLAEHGSVTVDVEAPPSTPATPAAQPTTAGPSRPAATSPRPAATPTTGTHPSGQTTGSGSAAMAASASPATGSGSAVAGGDGAAAGQAGGGANRSTGSDSGSTPDMPPGAVSPPPPAAALDASIPPSVSAAAEPLAAAPAPESQPIGLLALIAAVAVVGVSVGAIRAIIAQRLRRTSAT